MSDAKLQFDVAGARAGAAPTSCARCAQAISASYFTVNGSTVCASCRGQLAAPPPGSKSSRAFRALGYGALAALAGAIVYFAIAALTGYEFALVAILVGFAVGRAVRAGSGNRGGRAYQLLAVGLTYLAIVCTYVPLAIRELAKDRAAATTPALVGPRPPNSAPALVRHGDDSATVMQAGEPRDAISTSLPPDRAHRPRRPSVGVMIVGLIALVAIAAVAPLFAGFSNIIGILILALAVWQAWKINKRTPLVVNGPYRLAGAGDA